MQIFHEAEWLSPEARIAEDDLASYLLCIAFELDDRYVEGIAKEVGFAEYDQVRQKLALLADAGFVHFDEYDHLYVTEMGSKLLAVIKGLEEIPVPTKSPFLCS